jgi:hypothetical protein
MRTKYDIRRGEQLPKAEWKRRRQLINAEHVKRMICANCDGRLEPTEVHGGAVGLRCTLCGAQFVVAALDSLIAGHGHIYDPRSDKCVGGLA